MYLNIKTKTVEHSQGAQVMRIGLESVTFGLQNEEGEDVSCDSYQHYYWCSNLLGPERPADMLQASCVGVAYKYLKIILDLYGSIPL